MVVDLDRLHVGGCAALDLGARAAHPIQRKHDVVGRESLAIVELDAFAQIKAPLERIDDFPSFRQPRNDLEILVALSQPFHDIAHGAERERLVQRVGVERVEIALERIAKGVGGEGRGAECKHKRTNKGD
jgi:hypothetical protein